MLSLKNVNFKYIEGEANIVDNFSYDFEKWKIYAIIWKSGLWKSTLAKIMSGFLPGHSGYISLESNEIIKPSKKIIYINQENDIIDRLTVYENISILTENKKVVEYALIITWLYKNKSNYPKHLSGWMIKRLSFARALVVNPDILILDEPFVYLDHFSKKELKDILLHINNTFNTTVILITHDLEEALVAHKILYFESNIDVSYKDLSGMSLESITNITRDTYKI